jgi:hypothetical protein
MTWTQWWAQFKVRLGHAWQHLRTGSLLMDETTKGQWTRLQTLLESELSVAVQKAVVKSNTDPSFQGKQHALKRSEALGWTGVYLTGAMGAPKELWETSFLLEWHVGKANGKL